MSEAIAFLSGGGLVGFLTFLWLRSSHGTKRRADEQKYKRLWEEAVQLLSFHGQITDEQLAKLMPKATEKERRAQAASAARAEIEAVRAKEGLPPLRVALGMFSDDRRNTEITRAKAGLPPADTLEGMFSDDIAKVLNARAKFSAARKRVTEKPS